MNQVTISTHNGSAVAREHNIRNENVIIKEPHIDANGMHETWIDERPQEAYVRLFGQALNDYNNRQERPDRQIDDYYKHICQDDKKHPVYEMIIGIYGKDDQGRSVCSQEQGYELMKDFVQTWGERNPNLALIGAYYHADEQGEPHVHIDYVPVAHNYKKGMHTQTGLVKALGEQGYEKDGRETAQIKWERSENAFLDELCRGRGLEVAHPLEGREHLQTRAYKLSEQVKSLETQVKALEVNSDIKIAREQLQNANIQALEKWTEANKLKAKYELLVENQTKIIWSKVDECVQIEVDKLAKLKPDKKLQRALKLMDDLIVPDGRGHDISLRQLFEQSEKKLERDLGYERER